MPNTERNLVFSLPPSGGKSGKKRAECRVKERARKRGSIVNFQLPLSVGFSVPTYVSMVERRLSGWMKKFTQPIVLEFIFVIVSVPLILQE